MNDEERISLVKYIERLVSDQRTYFERVIAEHERRIEQALTAARDAVDKAEKAQERRLDLLNEFRAQSADEAKKYAQRDVVNPQIAKLEGAVQRAYGGLIVIGAVGLANLIRIWTG